MSCRRIRREPLGVADPPNDGTAVLAVPCPLGPDDHFSAERNLGMNHRGYWYGAVAAVLLLAGTGCSRLVKVEGTVTLDGKPLEGATVTFVPASGEGKAVGGSTDKDGVFRLTTDKYGDGIARGEYNVVITITMPPPPNPGIDTSMTSKEAMALGFKAMKKQQEEWKKLGKKLPEIPADYQDASKTPLKVHVPPDGPVVFDLQSVPSEKKPSDTGSKSAPLRNMPPVPKS